MSPEKTVRLTSASPEPLADGRFAGRGAFEKLVCDALAHAAHDGWPEVILSDATFEDWPLRERALVDALYAWARPGRKLTLLATNYAGFTKNFAKFVSWRKTWDHIVDCRLARAVAPLDMPSAIWSRDWFLHRHDLARSVGNCGRDRERSVQLRQMLDEKIRLSGVGFPASILGL